MFPVIKSLISGEYLRRLTMLRAVSSLLQGNPPDPFQTELLNLGLGLVNDSVPNVRLGVAKVRLIYIMNRLI